MRRFSQWLKSGLTAVLAVVALSCSANNDNAHTTATTVVAPPPHQELRVSSKPASKKQLDLNKAIKDLQADSTKPLLLFNLENGKTFKLGDDVVIDFVVLNAKLKGDGGDYRVRYIVDDDEMRWIDKTEEVWLSEWIAGQHTIRLELIGPDGWPYRNGNANVVAREIMVTK